MLLWKYSCFDKKLVSQWLVFWNTPKEDALEKLDDWKFYMYGTIGRIYSYEYSIKIIIVSLKELITRTNFFGHKHSTTERITQKMDDCKFSCQNINTVHFKEWMTAILSAKKNRYATSRDGLLQLEWWNKYKLPLKNSNLWESSSKKVAVLSK